MSVAKVTEIIASSKKRFEDAVREGVPRADKTLKPLVGAGSKDEKPIEEKFRRWSIRRPARQTKDEEKKDGEPKAADAALERQKPQKANRFIRM